MFIYKYSVNISLSRGEVLLGQQNLSPCEINNVVVGVNLRFWFNYGIIETNTQVINQCMRCITVDNTVVEFPENFLSFAASLFRVSSEIGSFFFQITILYKCNKHVASPPHQYSHPISKDSIVLLTLPVVSISN